ncbi:MAG: hypothetical protein JXB49_14555 [Bacteroidales bacterium]|nr:hypothetical protein [Bacteroidales bacterium]
MGAFFLFPKSSSIDRRRVLDIYRKKGFGEPAFHNLGSFELFHFPKQIIKTPNSVTYKNHSIYVVGSLFYKGNSFQDSIKTLLIDYINSCIDSGRLYGNFVVIIYKQNERVTFIFDKSFIKSVYYDPKNAIISTDLICIANSGVSQYTINKQSIIESLITGSLIPPSTYYNEIIRIDKNSVHLIDTENTRYFELTFGKQYEIHGYSESQQYIIEQLVSYFKDASNISNEFGAHIGLTGGLDSRLILMLARKNFTNLLTNSFWRRNSSDYEIAKQLASLAQSRFFSLENSTFNLPKIDEMLETGYYFMDGQIRSQNFWQEPFSLPSYCTLMANKHFVGFHGAGGEQYRNADRMNKSLNIYDWVEYDWIYKQGGNFFINEKDKNEFTNYLVEKIKAKIDVKDNEINLLTLKKVQNEVYNQSNRTTRLNFLNQLFFYFAPFTEYQIASTALKIVPHLGNSINYQIDLMNNIDHELSNFVTTYGFKLTDKLPLRYNVLPKLVNALPRKILYKIFLKYKTQNFNQADTNDIYISNSREYLADTLNFEKLLKNKYCFYNAQSIGFWLQKSLV